MPFSHHSHSGQFCSHAQDRLEEIVQAAIQRGMVVWGLTEHMPRGQEEDLYPDEVSWGFVWFGSYMDGFSWGLISLLLRFGGGGGGYSASISTEVRSCMIGIICALCAVVED